MNLNDLTDDLISKYFLMLPESRQKRIAGMNNLDERRTALCCEILARQCLSELCDAPEFAFELLCMPNGKSIVRNFDAEICITKCSDTVGCAVSYKQIGLGLVELAPFSFLEAQKLLSDSEIRCIFSDSKHSFAELINFSEIYETSVINQYAVIKSLKDAHFYSSGRGIRTDLNKIQFEFDGKQMICSDKNFVVMTSYISNSRNLAVSIVERSK